MLFSTVNGSGVRMMTPTLKIRRHAQGIVEFTSRLITVSGHFDGGLVQEMEFCVGIPLGQEHVYAGNAAADIEDRTRAGGQAGGDGGEVFAQGAVVLPNDFPPPDRPIHRQAIRDVRNSCTAAGHTEPLRLKLGALKEQKSHR